MEQFWKGALAVGGVAAIGAFVFWSLFKEWLKLPVFVKLTKVQTFILMILFLLLTFVAFGMSIWAYVQASNKLNTFPLTVYVHGEGGTGDMILKNSGFVMVDLGPVRLREQIGDRGQAYFPVISSIFRGEEVPVFLDAVGFEEVEAGKKYRLNGSNLYLAVHKKPGEIAGSVEDRKGQPIMGAIVTIGTNTTSTDASGHFDLVIPGKQLKAELSMEVRAIGFTPSRIYVVPNGSEIPISLQPNP